MIKLLQHVRDWTSSPDTDGAATVVSDEAWQFPKAKKADVSAPDATKPRARLRNTLLRRPHSTSAISVDLRERATWPM